jgi:hypothetical protein
MGITSITGKRKQRFSPLHFENVQFHQQRRSDRRHEWERTEIGVAGEQRQRGSAPRGNGDAGS